MTKYDDTMVHVTHCCGVHGCKYGDEDCPVGNHRIAAQYKCESCYDHDAYEDERERELSALREEIVALKLKLSGAKPVVGCAVIPSTRDYLENMKTINAKHGDMIGVGTPTFCNVYRFNEDKQDPKKSGWRFVYHYFP